MALFTNGKRLFTIAIKGRIIATMTYCSQLIYQLGKLFSADGDVLFSADGDMLEPNENNN